MPPYFSLEISVAKIQCYIDKTAPKKTMMNNYSKDYQTVNEAVGENERSILFQLEVVDPGRWVLVIFFCLRR